MSCTTASGDRGNEKSKLPPDKAAAHQFLSELRTRITTQPLPYQYGVEARALESLWEVFGQARDAMKKNPGCRDFARVVTEMLNVDLRPVTAKWHRAYTEGLLNSRDGSTEFRADLDDVQQKLRAHAKQLHKMAYDEEAEDTLTPPALSKEELDACFAPVRFGISKTAFIKGVADLSHAGGCPDVVDRINGAEAAAIAQRRSKCGITTPEGEDAVGLGLSGGGIRSATFCLGVTQVLAARGLLKGVDFLSTVSGGGYVGCFLTKRLGNGEDHATVAAPHGPDSEALRYLRQHAKFLTAVDLKQRWSMATAALAGMILNWTAPVFVIALAALAAIGFNSFWPNPPWLRVLAWGGGVTALALISYAASVRFGKHVHVAGTILAIATAGTLLLAFVWLLTFTYAGFPPSFLTSGTGWSIVGLLACASAAFPTVVRFLPILKKPTIRVYALKAALWLAGLIIPISAIALLFLLYALGTKPVLDAPWGHGLNLLIGITLFCGVVALGLLNINLTAPHRLYRDALARTFVQRSEVDTAPVLLKDINPQDTAPYHLINSTLNVPSSTHAALRERKSDFFVFSKNWCGAPSIGYGPTRNWMANGQPLDLATAMAVSGAAASSYMGLGSMPTLTALLAFLNVRLGFWILRHDRTPRVRTPGFLCLMREMTGFGMSEEHAWLNLSDGGHIENLGIYELLRRRCKFIISVDGEADPECTFHGHLTLVRHAQIDFGIRLDPKLSELRPDPASKYSQMHAMLARIQYPAVADKAAGIGLILYLKLSVTGNESELIRRYRLLNADFPHQTTLDQFFDEEQFEAYRRLGVHVAEGLFSPALLKDNIHPTTMPEWLRQLAKNMLVPQWS